MSDVLQQVLVKIQGTNIPARNKARSRLGKIMAPAGNLGRLQPVAEQVSSIMGFPPPPLDKKVVVVMASDHGIADEGVSAFPSSMTGQMVRNLAEGRAAVNAMSNAVGARVVIVDMGVKSDLADLVSSGKVIDRKVAKGTRNFIQDTAMTRAEAMQAIEHGIELANGLAADGMKVVVTGEIGIASTVSSSAIAAVVTGVDPIDVTGRGLGIDDATLEKKIEILRAAVRLHQPRQDDPIDVLSKVGGFEIAGLTGLILGAASHRVPVILDGVVSTAAALLATRFEVHVERMLFAGQHSGGAGHHLMLRVLGLEPLLNLSMRLGDGSGGVLAIPIVDGAVRILNEMAELDAARQAAGPVDPS